MLRRWPLVYGAIIIQYLRPPDQAGPNPVRPPTPTKRPQPHPAHRDKTEIPVRNYHGQRQE